MDWNQSAAKNLFTGPFGAGIPVVVTGVEHKLQGNWTPRFFIDRYGSTKVELVDTETGTHTKSTVGKYMAGMGNPGITLTNAQKLKASSVRRPIYPHLN